MLNRVLNVNILCADDTILILLDKDVNNLFKRCSQLFALNSVWFTDKAYSKC